MLYLILSIICATALVVLFRLFDKWKINSTHAIVFNYIFCVLTGLIFVDDFSVFPKMIQWNGFPIVVLLGFAFILIFLLVGKTALSLGVVTASIAMKLSFVIPVSVAIILYNDSITALKIIGIIFAIIAVYLIAYENESKQEASTKALIYPFLIFIGSGLCDTAFNYIQKKMMPTNWDHQVTIGVFAAAMVLGILLHFRDKKLYQWKNVLAGIILGIPNYFSLYFLLKTLSTLPWQSSVIFPVNNLGIVCLSAFIGFIIYKEAFNTRKSIGFILAISSIIIIGFIA